MTVKKSAPTGEGKNIKTSRSGVRKSANKIDQDSTSIKKTRASVKKGLPESDPSSSLSTSIGHRLRSIRRDNRLTQAEIAEKLLVSELTYSRYELGKRIPDAEFCAEVVKKFGVDASWLLFGSEAPTEGGSTKSSLRKTRSILNGMYTVIPVYELSSHKTKIRLTDTSKSSDYVSIPKNFDQNDLVAIAYHDRNMVPTILPGAIVGLSQSMDEKLMGHIYAVFIPRSGVKLYRAYNGNTPSSITLRSDNLATPEITISSSNFNRYALGRVVWVFQTMPS